LDDRFEQAIAAIDDRNGNDPFTIAVDGHERPKELAHAALMTEWVRRLQPDASPAQLLAARAHHVQRWVLDRSDYPQGRAGYWRWRKDLAAHHVAVVTEVLQEVGYDDETITRVAAIISKQGLGHDPEVQVHEDALCLVFLQTQLAPVTARLGREKTIDVVAKTVPKMSAAGIAAVAELGLADELVSIVAAAVERSSTVAAMISPEER
jgi:hypothetical protein